MLGRPLEKNDEAIIVKGARAHNLKNITVVIPRDSLTVITGPSGSGKSSLAFDTIYAEGQRRYVESLSVYARQFLEQMSKPEVESITGLSPTISIEQKTTSYNPRSTVGTVTETYDYLRLLYSRIAKASCWNCKKPIQSQTQQQMIDQILSFKEGTKITLMSPIVKNRKGHHQRELLTLRHRGFVRVRIDGETVDLAENIKIDKNKKHNIDLIVHRLICRGDKGNLEAKLSDSIELALKYGEGLLTVHLHEENRNILMSENFACIDCSISYPNPEPRTFSFNSPAGACPMCNGLGLDKEKLDVELGDIRNSEDREQAKAVEAELEAELEEKQIRDTRKIKCLTCNGARLRIESLHYKIANQNIAELCALPVSEIIDFFKQIKLTDREEKISRRVIKELSDRLIFLEKVGVSYLSLDRPAQSLSGGEAQRIRLATQIGSSLVGVIYVLDEPSIGLHPRDHDRLLSTLCELRDLGNTVLVIEHDKETIERADWVVDLGPGAGSLGGHVVASGKLAKIKNSKNSLTGQYLTGKKSIPIPKSRRKPKKGNEIILKGVSKNNLKNINVSFPLGLLVCVTGVSGSGKSSLTVDTFYKALMKKVYDSDVGDLEVKEIKGLELVDKVIDIDQTPIGRTPRSNPATYTGLFSLVRHLFSELPESKMRGYKPGRFSFNVKGGRCESCQGGGVTRVEMHFLPDVFVQCNQCRGQQYNRETLEIRFKGKNISEVLEMTAREALKFFESLHYLKIKLKILCDVGLGYITIGQRATTLSGGEAQRIKLSRELSKRDTGKTVYILDEPTTGLHFDDIKKLVEILQWLVDNGNTVIVIEHNADIVKVADHVIDLGPEGGKKGGQIIAMGTPEHIASINTSYTGQYLKSYLN